MRMGILSFSFLTIFWLPSTVLALDTIESLAKRIEELEKHQEQLLLETSEPRPQVNSFFNDNLTIGGFFEPSFVVIDGPDTQLQATNPSNTLGLNFAADLGSKFRFVSQVLTGLTHPLVNQHNDPKGASDREYKGFIFGAIVSQGYVEYSFNRSLTVQGGMGYVPFGYALQQRELVQFVRRAGPQILRTTDLVSPLWSGLHMFGSYDSGKSEWGYNLYTFTPLYNPKKPGLGGRKWWSAEDEKVVVGLSAQAGKLDFGSYETYGTDIKLDLNPFILKAEYAYQITNDEDPWSAYLEPSIYIYQEEVLFYVFGDYAYSPKNKTATIPPSSSLDPYKKWEFGTGINWLPTSLIRLRLGLTYHDYVGETAVIDETDRDYYSVDVSAGVAF